MTEKTKVRGRKGKGRGRETNEANARWAQSVAAEIILLKNVTRARKKREVQKGHLLPHLQ